MKVMVVDWRLFGSVSTGFGRVSAGFFVAGCLIGRGPRGGLRRSIVPVSHDVGEHRVMVETVGRLPAVGIVHDWVVRSMNLADSSKMRGASLSMVAT